MRKNILPWLFSVLFLITAVRIARADGPVSGGSGGTTYSSANPLTTNSGGTGTSTGYPDGRAAWHFEWRSYGLTPFVQTFGTGTVSIVAGVSPVTHAAGSGFHPGLVHVLLAPAAAATATVQGQYNDVSPDALGITDVVSVDNLLNNAYQWIGLFSADIANVTPSIAGGASGIRFFALAAGTGINSGKYICASGDGTNWSGLDVGVTAPAAYTAVVARLDWSTAGHLRCTVNGTTVDKTSNIPTGTTLLGYEIVIKAVTGTAAYRVAQITTSGAVQ